MNWVLEHMGDPGRVLFLRRLLLFSSHRNTYKTRLEKKKKKRFRDLYRVRTRLENP